jgi:hypothetical protein
VRSERKIQLWPLNHATLFIRISIPVEKPAGADQYLDLNPLPLPRPNLKGNKSFHPLSIASVPRLRLSAQRGKCYQIEDIIGAISKNANSRIPVSETALSGKKAYTREIFCAS